MTTLNLSNEFSAPERKIMRDEFVILSPTEMAKQETLGKRLNKRRLELGLSAAQLRQKIYEDHRFEIGESTIRGIEKDSTPNPGIKTVEFLALGLGLDPLEMIGMVLDDPPETDPGFTKSRLALFWKEYEKVRKEQRAFFDETIEMLIQKAQKSRR